MILAFLIGGILSHFSILYFPVLTISLIVLFLLILIKKRRFVEIMVFLAGFSYCLIWTDVTHNRNFSQPLLSSPKEIKARVVFSSCNKMSGSRQYICKILFKEADVNPIPKDVRVYLETEIPPGTEAEMVMQIRVKERGLVPGLFGRPFYVARPLKIAITGKANGIRWTVERQRQRLSSFFENAFSRETDDLAKALVTGERALNPSLREIFRKTGLSHLLTISGTHFGLLFFLFFNILRKTILLLPYRIFHRLTTYVSVNLIPGILTLPFLMWYLFISGTEIPAVRSFIMAVLFVFGLLAGRRYSWLIGILVAAAVILLADPLALFDLSFILSFFAVFFIGLGLERFKKERFRTEDPESGSKGLKDRILDFLRDSFFVSMAATLGTTPFVIYFFHYISPIGLVANIFITPFVCFIVLPVLLIISVFYLVTDLCFLEGFAEWLIHSVLKIIETLASFRYADIPVPPFPMIFILIMYVFILLFIFGNKLWRYIGIAGFASLWVLIFLMVDKSVSVTFIDVNQGDSSVIELPDGKTVVVDTGSEGIEISAYLRYRGKRIVDALILTHPHPDHIGGMSILKNNFKIKEIWDNGLLIYKDEMSDIRKRHLKRGDLIRGEDYTFLILHPYPGFYIRKGTKYNFENNSSLVMKFVYKGFSILMAGDIELEAEEDLTHLGNILKADILKVPHHGSRYSAHRLFFKLVSPQVAVISAGKENPYGHPHGEILRLLEGSNQFILFRDGTIRITISKDGVFHVKMYKDYVLKPVGNFRDEWRNLMNIFTIF